MTELQGDPRFNSIEARGRNAEELVAVLDSRFASKTRDEWMRFSKSRVHFTPVQALWRSPGIPGMSNNYFIEVDHPEWGNEGGRVSMGFQ